VPKKVSAAKVQKVLQAVAEQHPAYLSPAAGPKVVPNYTDSGAPAIVWEEGPEEWALNFTASTSISAALVSQAEGLFLEPVNHVALGVYPA